jgi:hypothetical protein
VCFAEGGLAEVESFGQLRDSASVPILLCFFMSHISDSLLIFDSLAEQSDIRSNLLVLLFGNNFILVYSPIFLLFFQISKMKLSQNIE